MSSDIRVVIPAEARFLRVARLTVAGIAGDIGFGLRDIEDLRVAVDELCAVMIEDAPDEGELELCYRITPGQLEIEGSCTQAGTPPEIHPVALELLSMTADEYEVTGDHGGRRFRLVKRHGDQPG